MNKRGKILLAVLGAYWLYNCRKTSATPLPVPETNGNTGNTNITLLPVITTPAGLSAPSNIWYGQSGTKYGSDYFAMLDQLPGENVFWFYGNTNGQHFPLNNAYLGNGYVECLFTSHSVTIDPSKSTVLAFVEYRVYDFNNKLVLYVKDTKGGFDPSIAANKRGNNHPDFCNRYLLAGQYRIEMKNISTNPAAVIKMEFGTILKGYLQPGQSATWYFDLFDWYNNGGNVPKVNCNLRA